MINLCVAKHVTVSSAEKPVINMTISCREEQSSIGSCRGRDMTCANMFTLQWISLLDVTDNFRRTRATQRVVLSTNSLWFETDVKNKLKIHLQNYSRHIFPITVIGLFIIYYKTRTHSTHKNEERNKNRKLNRIHIWLIILSISARVNSSNVYKKAVLSQGIRAMPL